MSVAVRMKEYMKNSSWIRRMFEEGARLKAIHGAGNVYDFSLGNPDVPPPVRVIDTMAGLARTMSHGYMPNAGYPDARAAVARHAAEIYEVPLSGDDIVMTCGAGGGSTWC
jgi:aspartate aminotransferase